MARNPDVQERVYNEIIEVSEQYDHKFAYEALQEMTLLESALYGKRKG